jgi:hypothetical protein
MGKYTGSPWGEIRGKTGSAVGGTWKGLPWTRAHGKPRQQGTVKKYDLGADGCTRGIRFSQPQLNFRRAVFATLGNIARMTHESLIIMVWQTLCDKKRWKMTGLNKFISTNARLLWLSMRGDIHFGATNTPDMTKMLVSDGDLEATPSILSATIPMMGGNHVTITWDTTTYQNGSPADDAWLAVYKVPSADFIIRMQPFGTLFVKGSGVTRSAGSAIIPVPVSQAGDLTAFVFFSDNCSNYSPSAAKQAEMMFP